MSLIQAGGAVLGGALGGKDSGGAPKWLRRGAKSNFQFAQNLANQPYQAYTGERVAPFSDDTMAAFDLFRGRVGQDPYGGAISGIQGMLGYQPQQVQSGYSPGQVNVPWNVGDVNAQQLQTQYNAPQFAGQDISPYMNPFTNEVIDRSMGDIERQRQITDSALNAQAAQAGAFGGSRHGVANSLTNDAFARQAADSSAQLRMAGYQDAAGRLENDLGRQWMATELGQRSGFANQQADLQAQLANQGMQAAGAQFGLNQAFGNEELQRMAAQMGLSADMFNSEAGLNAFGANLQGYGMLGNMIGAQQGLQQSDLSRLFASGMTQDQHMQQQLDVPYQNYLDQQNWGPRNLSLLNSALGTGAAAIGGQAPSQGGGLAGILGGAQLGGQAAGSIYDLWKGVFNQGQQPAGFELDFSPQWNSYQYGG
jgi:hypothetical protein